MHSDSLIPPTPARPRRPGRTSAAPVTTDEAALAAAAAHAALSSAWHLAILSGRDEGLVVPLPERGTVGRDGVLTDQAVSRSHLRVRQTHHCVLLSDAGSANGARVRGRWRWHELGPRPLRCRAGTRLRMGETLVELRRRPTDLHPPQPPTPAQSRWMLVGSLLAVVLMATLAVVTARTGNRGALGALAAAPMGVMLMLRVMPMLGRRRGGTRAGTAGWRGRRARTPDPAGMLLAVAVRHAGEPGRTHGRGHADEAEEIRAWTGRRRRRTLLRVAAGDRVALTGPAAVAAVRWWGAQVLARGFGLVRADEAAVHVSWGAEQRRSEVTVTAADAGAPARTARAVSVLPVRGRTPDLGHRWWTALLAAAGLPPPEAGAGPGTAPGPPSTVRLEDVCADLDRELLRRRWQEAIPTRLPAVLGVGADGPVSVDLVRDGPHALLAGTTGSGKSELLIAWLLQLTAACPPTALSLILVDYKGGAALGPLAELPHTAGVLTDLDPASTHRALASLEAEVRRRERLLAEHGAKDVSFLHPADAPARLVLVVDEFATLASEHPDVLDALVRVAAQGRSLGIHLILATQRPGGAVSPTIRANTNLRVCLRVLDPADSRDVLGHDGAARIEPHPGRVLISAAPDARAQVLQAPWCGTERHLEALIGEVAAAVGPTSPWRPWAPPLPARVHRRQARMLAGTQEAVAAPVPEDAPERHRPAPAGAGCTLLLTDLPEQQRLGTWEWLPSDPLLIMGAPGCGRSTTVYSAAVGALVSGVTVHVCAQRRTLPARLAGVAGVGTVVGGDDPRRLARLWSLAAAGSLRGDLLAIDDVDVMLAAVDEALGPGEGQALLESLVRAAASTGTGVLLAAPFTVANARWTAPLRRRLVLGATQPAQASLAGLPRGVVTGRGPGRGVLLDGAEATACQVVLPEPHECGAAGSGLRRLEEIPRRAQPAPGVWAVGGDRAAPVPLPDGPVLVLGPPGSGRSNAVAALARCSRTPHDGDGTSTPVVVDDLDLSDSATQARVEAALGQGRRVIASATTERAAGTYRGPLAVMRERGAVLVLWPGLGPAAQAAGRQLRGSIDPRGLTAPGRGVLVWRGSLTPLQVVAETGTCTDDHQPTSG
ncbi:FtsK/SpoIIIE domain-containing protein [Actinomyces ruminicola]|uniref:DNA segregation ATPase FtsK/SpoIIIE, S-DNA-T family n=1 Tax=Actinomyces ruminicola TaxID=332524 RepID=A0A1G9XMD1_9ACTO|nr:FtsK/SpoIIIE domain-containing protein [Actinomyces ruminicola]SDM97934.1 DNA segregation ATPase FtsK/SpoIIIE, S-DNA-T family [Actinomyces ruminicola]